MKINNLEDHLRASFTLAGFPATSIMVPAISVSCSSGEGIKEYCKEVANWWIAASRWDVKDLYSVILEKTSYEKKCEILAKYNEFMLK